MFRITIPLLGLMLAGFAVAAATPNGEIGGSVGGPEVHNPGHCGGSVKDETAPFILTAVDGSVYNEVFIKAGQQCFAAVTSDGTVNDGCYLVIGIGTPVVSFSRIGEESPLCQEISHVEGNTSQPTITATPTTSSSPSPTPNDPTPSPSPTPTSTTIPTPTPTSTPTPTATPTSSGSPRPSVTPTPDVSPTPTATSTPVVTRTPPVASSTSSPASTTDPTITALPDTGGQTATDQRSYAETVLIIGGGFMLFLAAAVFIGTRR